MDGLVLFSAVLAFFCTFLFIQPIQPNSFPFQPNACPIQVLREPKPVTKPYALKVSLTERGQAAAAVIRRWEE